MPGFYALCLRKESQKAWIKMIRPFLRMTGGRGLTAGNHKQKSKRQERIEDTIFPRKVWPLGQAQIISKGVFSGDVSRAIRDSRIEYLNAHVIPDKIVSVYIFVYRV